MPMPEELALTPEEKKIEQAIEKELDALGEEELAKSFAAAQEEFEKMGLDGEPEVTEDFSSAIGLEEEEWFIDTGRRNATGVPIHLKVVVRDPGNSNLALAYVYAKDKEEATRRLWEKVIVSPKEISQPEHFKKIRTAPRNMLTWRILGLMGINGDFFETLQKMASGRERRAAHKLSTRSLRSMESRLARLKAGQQKKDQTPSTTPEPEKNVSEPTLSSTPNGQPSLPSEPSPNIPSTTPPL